MILTEENYIEVINSFTPEDRHPLLELISEIEKTEVFGELGGLEKSKDGVTTSHFGFTVSSSTGFLRLCIPCLS